MPTLIFFDAAQPIAVATVSGDIDIGVTGLTAGFYNLAAKGGLRIIGAQSREEPGYHLIAYLAGEPAPIDAGLTSLKDFPGHAVAVTQVGSTFHYSLGLLAEKLGFPLDRVRVVPLQTMSNEASALQGSQVDAALMPATVALPLVSRGEAHLLGWVGDETPWQLGAIFATQQTIAAHRALVASFIAAYRRGAHDFYDAFLVKGPDGAPRQGADGARASRHHRQIHRPVGRADQERDPLHRSRCAALGERHPPPGRLVSKAGPRRQDRRRARDPRSLLRRAAGHAVRRRRSASRVPWRR